jgi:hypothetical protein
MVKLGKEQPFERGITCSVGSIDHEATTSIGGGSSRYEDMVDRWEYVELKNNWKDVEFPAKEKLVQDKLF